MKTEPLTKEIARVQWLASCFTSNVDDDAARAVHELPEWMVADSGRNRFAPAPEASELMHIRKRIQKPCPPVKSFPHLTRHRRRFSGPIQGGATIPDRAARRSSEPPNSAMGVGTIVSLVSLLASPMVHMNMRRMFRARRLAETIGPARENDYVMTMQSRVHRSLVGLVAALVVGALLAGPVGASTASVTQQITSGSMTASIDGGSMNDIAYSNNPQTTIGQVHLAVSDASGSGQGWNVTVASSAFVYGGTSTIGQNIPAGNFSITTAGIPSYVAGQAISATGGPLAGVGGTLDTARKTIFANSGFGSGSYAQDLDLQLNVPAQSQAGTYTATLTVAIAVGP
jgi:hypothetical protein